MTLANARAGDQLVVNLASLPSGITVDPASTAVHVILAGSATMADYQFALQQVAFNNTSDNPDPTPRTISVTVNDGVANSSPAIATIAIDRTPEAVDDAAATPVNTAVTTNNVLANDDQGDGPASVTAFDTVSAAGGMVVNNGGTFIYTPAGGFTGTDTFTYTISDSDGDQSSATVVVATVAVSSAITLSGHYGYSSYSVSGLDALTTIDASAGSWIVANSRNSNPVEGHGANTGDLPINRYPFLVENAAPGLIIKGGVIYGEVPQSSDWTYTYADPYPDGVSANSAALRVESSPGVTIQDWRISNPWDGIRVAGTTETFTITRVWISGARDDAVENDDALSGTISDSLFDGVFVGVSLDGDVDGNTNTVTFDGMLLRMQPYLYKGEITHGTPIKTDSGVQDVTPSLRFLNCIIAIEDPNHEKSGPSSDGLGQYHQVFGQLLLEFV